MEIKIDKSIVMRVSRSNESLQIKVNNREIKKMIILNILEVCYQEMVSTEGNQYENCHCQRSI